MHISPNKFLLPTHPHRTDIITKFFRENKEMACRCRSLLLASLALVLRRCRRRQEENKKQKRRFWARKILTEERKERGEWEYLFHELSNDDREYYYRYLCMSPERAIVSANKKLN